MACVAFVAASRYLSPMHSAPDRPGRLAVDVYSQKGRASGQRRGQQRGASIAWARHATNAPLRSELLETSRRGGGARMRTGEGLSMGEL